MKKKKTKVPKGRWLPTDNTRGTVFRDRKKHANKKACRGSLAQLEERWREAPEAPVRLG